MQQQQRRPASASDVISTKAVGATKIYNLYVYIYTSLFTTNGSIVQFEKIELNLTKLKLD